MSILGAYPVAPTRLPKKNCPMIGWHALAGNDLFGLYWSWPQWAQAITVK